MVKVNGKKVEGAMGCLVAFMVLAFIGVVFFIIALVLLSPLLIPGLIGFLLGKAL